MFNLKPEKIYKFVYEDKRGFNPVRCTMLITASDPVKAVKEFNRRAGDKLYNIIEFTQMNLSEDKNGRTDCSK